MENIAFSSFDRSLYFLISSTVYTLLYIDNIEFSLDIETGKIKNNPLFYLLNALVC